MKRSNLATSALALVGLVFLTTGAWAVPIGGFLNFGTSAGDVWFGPSDDGTVQTGLASPFPFFGTSYAGLWVNNNGNLSFGSSNTSYIPGNFPGDKTIIAPYWGDVDTRGNSAHGWVPGDGFNDLYYGQRNGAGDLSTLSGVINAAFGTSFAATSGFVATWDHVGWASFHEDPLNTFQVALATDGLHSFAILHYLDDGMAWENPVSGQYPIAGYDKGDYTHYYAIPGSKAPGIANVLEDGSNIGVAGRWIFSLNEPMQPIPESASATLLCLGLALAGLGVARVRRRK